jgi:formylglycine-generating enzyme required for sulfatase activity
MEMGISSGNSQLRSDNSPQLLGTKLQTNANATVPDANGRPSSRVSPLAAVTESPTREGKMTINSAVERKCSELVKPYVLLLLAVVPLGGCHGDAHGEKARGQGTPPEAVSVPGAEVTLGFYQTLPRQPRRLDSFRVTKRPITGRQYRACVAAGACAEAHTSCDGAGGFLGRSTYGDETASDVPVTCVLPAQAELYCAWVGGRLPTASEWLLAVRGPSVHKYAWGDEAPTCARHPQVEGILADARSCCNGDDACTINDLARVGTHASGASPAGIEDALFARGELVKSDREAPLADCGDGVCLILGRGAAIENLIAAPADEAIASTFRCVFDGGGK